MNASATLSSKPSGALRAPRRESFEALTMECREEWLPCECGEAWDEWRKPTACYDPAARDDAWDVIVCSTCGIAVTNFDRLPPGPDDAADWAAAIAERPDLAPALRRADDAQPALRRVADGPADGLERALAYRPDRLRALGNGVVPQTAALAFAELWRRLHGG